MKLGPLHHVAIAVPRIEEALPFYRDTLGLSAAPVRELPDQHVRVTFLGDPGQKIELLEPLDRESGVAKFVAERGRPCLHHVCYVVDDLAGTLTALERDGIELIDRAPRKGAEGMVAFIHPRGSGGVLIELIDRASLDDSVWGSEGPLPPRRIP
ncbi:MAG TPA: methylmalonyl-CoA epimerase [Candidatus Limnocylindria bacterium]|nr:methylmalonyl-CoA epimerase [Candidatus Limnocylindria bacterium]